MKQFTIILYSDPSHSFGKVKRKIVNDLKLANLISSYSYQRGDYVYLECDNDLSQFCQRINEHNTTVKFVQRHTDKESRIRSYERYQP